MDKDRFNKLENRPSIAGVEELDPFESEERSRAQTPPPTVKRARPLHRHEKICVAIFFLFWIAVFLSQIAQHGFDPANWRMGP